MSEVNRAFEASCDFGIKSDPVTSRQHVIEVKALVPPDSVRLDVPREVEEVGWWIMSRTEPEMAARFGSCEVDGVRRARYWVQSLLEFQLALRTDGLLMMKPKGWLHPDERGWRLSLPLGTDATHLDPLFYRAFADLTDGRLEAGISLLAAWMSFVNDAPRIGGPAAATLDATHCLMVGLRAGGKRLTRSEDGPSSDRESG